MVAHPKRVKVGPNNYYVTETMEGLLNICGDAFDANAVNGVTDREMNLIALSPRLALSKKQETSVHEVLHTAFDFTALSYEKRISAVEELLCHRLAPALLMIVRDNPKLVDFWQATVPN